MIASVDIAVVRDAATWKIKYGAVVLDYATQAEALGEAIALAHAFGREGQFSTVRSGVMTSVYGPNGFIRAVPTPKRSEPAAPLIEPKERRSRENPPEKLFAPHTAPKSFDEKGRVQRIASAFEVKRGGSL